MADWSTACPDWEDRLLSGRSLVPDLPLFKSEADRALRIFKRLRMPDVFGTPTNGEACAQWVFDIVAALFGSYDPKTNRRMITEFFVVIPKKNGKSSIAAAIMVTAAIMNRRPEAEILLIAPTKKIADIAFKQAFGIIRLDPELSKLFHPQEHVRAITHRHPKNRASIQIKAADTDTITGSKATFILLDETHVFAKKSKAADIFVEIRGSLASRPDGFMLQITTQSKDPPSGVFRTELRNARDVRDGKLVLPLLPIIYELPDRIAKDGGWKDRKNWPLVNPNIGRSVDEAFLVNQLLTAEREGVAQLALLASQHFNVEVGVGLKTDSWSGAEFWQACADKSLTLDVVLARSDVVVVGIDGGGLDDLLGLAVLGRDKNTGEWLLWSHAWAHQIVLERRKEIASRLLDFEKQGDLTIVAMPGDDVEELATIVLKIEKTGKLAQEHAVGVDAMGIGEVVNALTECGIDRSRIIGIAQGVKLHAAIQTTGRKLAGGELLHGGRPIMDWSVGNAKVEQKGSAVTITKQTCGTAKIDLLMGLYDAVSVMATNPQPKGKSYLESAEKLLMLG